MVFSKVGASVFSVMASISALASSIDFKKAGLKCSFFICEKGAVSKGDNNGFIFQVQV